jgi:hypothetical protein
MICIECAAAMQETSPDVWNCSGCGFQAVQTSLWEGVNVVQFNTTPPDYNTVTKRSMTPGEKAALEAKERDRPRINYKGTSVLAPQQGKYGGKHYKRKGGER